MLFVEFARLVSKRSTCARGQVGAVLVRDKRPIANGYNGAPPGMLHCLDVGCLIGPDGGCARSIHAEANLLAWAARAGVRTEGCDLYCTASPCWRCAQLVASAGVARVIYENPYRVLDGIELLDDCGVQVLCVSEGLS